VHKNRKAGERWPRASESGIKPGSADFHALKQGNIQFSMDTGTSKGKGKNKKPKKNKHG
jgi:hypothetical protein